jgi:hypothetical protein
MRLPACQLPTGSPPVHEPEETTPAGYQEPADLRVIRAGRPTVDNEHAQAMKRLVLLTAHPGRVLPPAHGPRGRHRRPFSGSERRVVSGPACGHLAKSDEESSARRLISRQGVSDAVSRRPSRDIRSAAL